MLMLSGRVVFRDWVYLVSGTVSRTWEPSPLHHIHGALTLLTVLPPSGCWTWASTRGRSIISTLLLRRQNSGVEYPWHANFIEPPNDFMTKSLAHIKSSIGNMKDAQMARLGGNKTQNMKWCVMQVLGEIKTLLRKDSAKSNGREKYWAEGGRELYLVHRSRRAIHQYRQLTQALLR